VSDSPADGPRWTPPGWLNRTMTWILKTPGLQRLVGKGTALMTFTGRKTGQAFTTPVSYVEFDGEIAITCHRTRQWWRNLAANPDVGLRLAGHERRGIATVLDDPDDAFDVFVKLLKAQPAVARVSDIPLDAHGMPDPVKTREVLAYTMVVTIKLEEV